MGYCSKGIEIDNLEIKIIMFVIELDVKSIVVPCNEGESLGNLLGHQICWLFQQSVGRGKSF